MIEAINNDKLQAAFDVLTKNGQMGAYQAIINTETKQIVMEKELYSKDWSINTNRAAETIILLDIIAIIQAKSYSITNGRIPKIIDNKKVW